MQMFGLVALLVTIAISALWFISSVGGTATVVNENGEAQAESTYQEAINSAKEAVGGQLGKKVTIYDNISVSESILVLDLSDKGLTGSLNAEVRQLTKLRELDISDNDFTGLPAEVGHLSQLEVLNLSGNPFTGLPLELGNLQNLKVLDLRNTKYSAYDLDLIKEKLPTNTQILVD